MRRMIAPLIENGTSLTTILKLKTRACGVTVGFFLMTICSSTTFAYESIAIPEWRLQVVDGQGKPVKGATVVVDWQNYSFESDRHHDHEPATSDVNGFVTFPPSKVSGSVIKRLWGPVMIFLGRLVGSENFGGISAYVQASLGGVRGTVLYHGPPQPLPSRIVLGKSN
jgi:hypothetical protein